MNGIGGILSAAMLAGVLFPGDAAAEAWGTRAAVGFHYPGVSARVAWRRVVLEAIYLQAEGSRAVGPRVYGVFNPGARVRFNGGVEYAWVDGEAASGAYDGRATTGFLGLEAFATRRVSVGLDMGLCRVAVDGRDGTSAGETSLVANMGLHFYL